MIGKTVSHYKILEKLGEGGMGVVYRAEDTRLRRTVALKFLPSQVTRDPRAKERFIQEAQTASAIDHPSICIIHEIDTTDDGRMFIAMACYEGETIKEKIVRGPLGLKDAVNTALSVARGLAKAHALGIVHRDIKPANIYVTREGQIKILDFGLAKLTGHTNLTTSGMALGTAAYMSPEQARGDRVDHRTDIWSLGVVMYEMLTGERPFKGDYEPAITYSILNESPEPMRSLVPHVPRDLERVVDRMLKKDAAERYQSVQEVVLGLSSALVPEPPLRRRGKSMAVLPFIDLSPGKDNEYFSDGLSEEIITGLSKVEELRVISRSSAMTFKGTHKTIMAIAKELGVQYVLEGSVRKAGDNLRITAQLIDATNDVHLWARVYRGTLTDVFDIQERVAHSIVNALRLTLKPSEQTRLAERPLENVHAYECYLRARQEIRRWTEEGLGRALQHFQNGLEIIGDNALLYAGIGSVYWWYVNMGVRTNEEFLDKAETYAKKVFELEPDSPHGHRLLGLIAIHRGNLRETATHLSKALAINPNDTEALVFLSTTYVYCGRGSAARALVDRLLEIDPLSPTNYFPLVIHHIMEGRFSEALEPSRKMYRMGPAVPLVGFAHALSLSYNNLIEQACEVIERLTEEAPEVYPAHLGLLLKRSLQKDKANAIESISPQLEAQAKRDPEISWVVADCFALLDEKEQALHWLENAVNRGFINYPFLSEYDPFLENVRREERFRKLMERVKSEWEGFEV